MKAAPKALLRWATCLVSREVVPWRKIVAGHAAGEKCCLLSVTLPTDVLFDGIYSMWELKSFPRFPHDVAPKSGTFMFL